MSLSGDCGKPVIGCGVDIQRGTAGSGAIAFSGLLQKLLTMETFKSEIEMLLIYHAVLSSHAAFSIIATR